MFDAQTVFTSIVSMLGYAPEGAWKNQRAVGETRSTYAAEERFGLVLPSLKKALETAKAIEFEYPNDAEVKEAVSLLTQLNLDARYFSQYLKQPWNLWKQLKEGKGFLGRLRETRRQLLKLTYSGAAFSSEIKNLPESWKEKSGLGAARIAAMCFQNAFLSYQEGSDSLSHFTPSAHPLFQKVPGDAARAQYQQLASQQLQFVYPTEYEQQLQQGKSPEEAAEALRLSHPVQHRLVLSRLLNAAYDQKTSEEKSYEDPVQGWFAKWQIKRAKAQALRAFAKETGRKFDPRSLSEEDQVQWRRIYAEKMMQQMGMVPVYDETEAPGLQQAVEAMAKSRFEAFEKSGQVQNFLAGRPSAEEFLDRMRAIFTAQAYLDVTTRTNLVPATSPAQPGLFQKLRNSKLVRGLPKAVKWPFTVTSRFVEAATHADGHHLGFKNWFRRNVPVLTDMKEAALRTMQLSLIYLSVVWLWNYQFWHIEMPWYLHASSFFLGYPLVVGPQLFLQRAFKNIGWKPTDTFKRRAIYAFIYSWATFLGYFPTQYFEPEAREWVNAAGSLFLIHPVEAAQLPSENATCAGEVADRG